ncbi:hypothetical protein Tco_0175190 [Tanacetum coccineum]
MSMILRKWFDLPYRRYFCGNGGFDKTPPLGDVSSDFVSSDSVSSDSDSEDEKALRRDLEMSRAQARKMKVKWSTCRVEIALLESKNKITDIGEFGKCHVEKRMDETEMKLESTCMEREMVYIRGVPKPSSDDEDTERPRKKSKKSSSDWDRGIFRATWNA